MNDDGSFTVDDMISWVVSPIDVNADGIVSSDPCGTDADFLASMLLTMDPSLDADGSGYPDVYETFIGGSCGLTARSNTNGDSELDIFDLVLQLALFDANDPAAEFTGDSPANLTDLDLRAFVALLQAGT